MDDKKRKIIKLGKGCFIDLEKLIETRLLVEANSGGGKSWLLRVLLEQSHEHVQQIVIDLEGEFNTLREKYDYILAGKDGDIPADPRSAGLLARKLMELEVSAIVDIYELKKHQRIHFVKEFLEALINIPKHLYHPVLVIVDEAHIFCPEGSKAESTAAVIDLATRGRVRGICCCLATQRLSKLNKDAAAECNNVLFGRTTLDIDRKRVSEILGMSMKESHKLMQLEAGEFFAFGPAISREVIKTKIRPVKSLHPRAGYRIQKSKPVPPTKKIKGILQKLTDLPEEAEKEARTIKDYQGREADLRRKIRSLEAAKPEPSEVQIQKAIQHEKALMDGKYIKAIDARDLTIKRLFNAIDDLNGITSKAVDIPIPEALNVCIEYPPEKRERHIKVPVYKKNFPQASKVAKADNCNISGGARKILGVLASHAPVKFTKAQLGTLSGYAHRGGSFNTYISALNSNGLIIKEGNFIQISEEGISYLGGSIPEPKTGAELVAMWLAALPGKSKNMLEMLIEAYPGGISKEELGIRVGMVHTGGSFNTYLSKLRSNCVIETKQGLLYAADSFFLS